MIKMSTIIVSGAMTSLALLMVLRGDPRENEPSVPRIHVANPSIDLGTVPLTDDPLHVSFDIKNWGQSPLRIEGAQLSCGCARPELPKEDILPNESATVRINVESEFAGEKSVSVTLLTNDPVNPRMTLSARWVGTSGFKVEPSHVDFGEVEAGTSIRLSAKLSRMTGPHRALTVKTEPDSLQAKIVDDELIVTLNPDPYPVDGRGLVRISIEGEKARPDLVPVR